MARAVTWFPHHFEGRVVHHDLGTYQYTVVFLPPDIAAELSFDATPRLRFTGEFNDLPFSGAWQPVRGAWYVMLSKPLLREAGVGVGDLVQVRFRIEDPEAVDVPVALTQAIGEDEKASAAWASLSAGKQWAFAYRVAGAKSAPTSDRRISEVIAAFRGEGVPALARLLGSSLSG